MGKLHAKGVLENHLRDQSFRLVHWLSVTLSLRRTSQESINLERKSYLECSSSTLCTRWNLEGGWHNGCRRWGVGNDGRIINLLEKTQCKGSNIPKENGKFIFPVADGRTKFVGGDQELRTPTLIREHPIRGESYVDFLGESEGSLLPPLQDSLPDACEAVNDFWSMSGNLFTAITLNPESNLTRREKNHSLFH